MYATKRVQDEQAGWYMTLQMQSHMLFRDLQQQVAKMHDEVKNPDNSKGAVVCMRCNKKRHRLDVVQFVCHPEKRALVRYERDHKATHSFCHWCLETLFAQQDKYLTVKKNKEGDSAEDRSEREHAEFLLRLANHKLRVLPCPECKTPNVLTQESRFFESVERHKAIDASGVMKAYANHREATFRFVDNFVVEKVYENQRRPMFGSFSKDNLLITDWGGQFTDESQAQVLESITPPPNSAWFWIESYAADTARNGVDMNGWEYGSFSWNSKFSARVSMFDFVRKRRLLHTRIRVSQELRAELAAIAQMPQDAEEEAAQLAAQQKQEQQRRKTIPPKDSRDRDFGRASSAQLLYSPVD